MYIFHLLRDIIKVSIQNFKLHNSRTLLSHMINPSREMLILSICWYMKTYILYDHPNTKLYFEINVENALPPKDLWRSSDLWLT